MTTSFLEVGKFSEARNVELGSTGLSDGKYPMAKVEDETRKNVKNSEGCSQRASQHTAQAMARKKT
jgi:hypothetical protein